MMRRAVVAALALAVCMAASGNLHAQTDALVPFLTAEGWTDISDANAAKSHFQDLFDRTNWNLSTYTECATVKDAADGLLTATNGLFYW